jgi:hypothetical protein
VQGDDPVTSRTEDLLGREYCAGQLAEFLRGVPADRGANRSVGRERDVSTEHGQ